MGISVLKPGMATTVQDTGRPSYYNVGILLSGSLDLYSSVVGNILVGNDDDAAVLECTYMGPELRFDQSATVAVTGAELPPKVNGEPRPTGESFAVDADDVLTFDFLETEWRLTPVADRTGFRYQGGELEFRDRTPPFGAGSDPSNIVDAPYPIGSIQVPGGIEPIILHRDAVSGGGYVMIATVISADMDLVGQSAPNTTTRFVEVDLDTALQARRDRADRLEAVRAAVA